MGTKMVMLALALAAPVLAQPPKRTPDIHFAPTRVPE